MIEMLEAIERLSGSGQTVEMSLEEYTELTEKVFLADMILDALYTNATLSYTGKELSFSAIDIGNILKYGDSGIYHERFMMLKAESEKAKAEKERDEMIQIVSLKEDEEEQSNGSESEQRR